MKSENKEMLRIGCHLSSARGYLAMGKTARQIGATTFQFFTRNPRGGSAKAIDPEDIRAFLDFCEENDIKQMLAHAPYTLNGCSGTPRVREFARETMKDDLERLEYTPGLCYNFHPGSHVGQGTDTGIEYIADMLNTVMWQEQSAIVLLETMAGKGSEIGGCFEELRAILDRVHFPEKMGVCMDTCHVWDSGYDIVNNLDNVLNRFDQIIGIEKLRAIHLNDSMNPLGAGKDRHARIGEGHIGYEALCRVVCHPLLRKLPFYLETPNELDGYAREIHMMREAWEKTR